MYLYYVVLRIGLLYTFYFDIMNGVARSAVDRLSRR